MNEAERGYLLLTCFLGIPDRRVITPAQLRNLTNRVRGSEHSEQDRDLETADLLALGYSRADADRILALLSEDDLLEGYLRDAAKAGCVPLSRVSPDYPSALTRKLGADAPGCLWAKGDLTLLRQPCIALVGSRELHSENERFARTVGEQAAKQGYVLLSGNAKGADQTAQESCLAAGGRVISVVADRLDTKPERKNVLWLSEQGFDLPFSAVRALSRNRVIHCMGQAVIAAQCSYRTGGTWDGSLNNLKHEWSRLWCFRDGSKAVVELSQLGAREIGFEDLADLTGLTKQEETLFDL